jgi:hypothetical protein
MQASLFRSEWYCHGLVRNWEGRDTSPADSDGCLTAMKYCYLLEQTLGGRTSSFLTRLSILEGLLAMGVDGCQWDIEIRKH